MSCGLALARVVLVGILFLRNHVAACWDEVVMQQRALMLAVVVLVRRQNVRGRSRLGSGTAILLHHLHRLLRAVLG